MFIQFANGLLLSNKVKIKIASNLINNYEIFLKIIFPQIQTFQQVSRPSKN